MRTRAAARRIVCVLFYGKQRASGDIPHNKLKEATGRARVLTRDAGRERWQAAGPWRGVRGPWRAGRKRKVAGVGAGGRGREVTRVGNPARM